MTEVRSFKANCQGCTKPQCVNGDSPVPDPSDTFALKGCTMGLKNNQLRDMGHVSSKVVSRRSLVCGRKITPNNIGFRIFSFVVHYVHVMRKKL